MFSLFRLHPDMTGQWEQLITVDSWEQMIRVVEQYFDIIQVVDGNWLPVPSDYETAFKDEHGDVYVVYRMMRSRWDTDRYYDDYYDDIDRQTQQRRELERWEYIFRNPDLLIKKYWPKPALIEANRKNEWYVGALHD